MTNRIPYVKMCVLSSTFRYPFLHVVSKELTVATFDLEEMGRGDNVIRSFEDSFYVLVLVIPRTVKESPFAVFIMKGKLRLQNFIETKIHENKTF